MFQCPLAQSLYTVAPGQSRDPARRPGRRQRRAHELALTVLRLLTAPHLWLLDSLSSPIPSTHRAGNSLACGDSSDRAD